MPGRFQPALLEREAERTVLESALTEANRGAGRLVVIEGSAGIGKTRLLEEARNGAARAGMRVLAARGTELERDFPFALVRQAFEPELVAMGSSEREEILAGAAGPAGPALGLESPAVDAGSLADPSFATLNGLYWLTSNLAEAQPTLLAFDDVHWSDSSSLRFLRFLVPRLEDLPVAVVIAARAEEGGSEFPPLIADPAGSVIRPHELSPAAVAELVRVELSADADEKFCLACRDASGGNPFMLQELLAELGTQGSGGNAAEAAHVREVAPATIQRAVLVRLARLPESASRLARAVAVMGDGVGFADAAELAGLNRAAAAAAADSLAGSSILEPGRPLRFVHPLVRTAVYADLASAEKGAAHRRTAELLELRGAEPERIAVHLLATDPAEDPTVVDALNAAARRALDRAAPEPAIAYVRRALLEPPAREARLDLLRLLARAFFRAGDRTGFEELLESGALEELATDPKRLMDSAAEFGHLLYAWGGVEKSASLLERVTAAAIDARDYDLAARFEAFRHYWTLSAPAHALAGLDRFEDRIEPGSPTERLYLALRAWWGMFTGEPPTNIVELARRSVKDATIWHEYADTPIPTVATTTLRWLDALDDAERTLDEQIEELGSRAAWSVISAGWERGELALLRGRVAEAEAEVRTTVEFARQGGWLLTFPTPLAALVEILVERDELAVADGELAAAGVSVIPDQWRFVPLLYSRARLRIAQGRAGEALEDLLAFRRVAADAGLRLEFHPAFAYLALALNAVGDRAEAKSVAERELASARAYGLSRRIGIALRTLGLLEGGERGLELLRESVDVLDASPASLEQARTATEYGAALRRANRRAEAREPLRAALEWARPAGALAVARRAHEELEAAGEKLRPLLAGGVGSLTPSERRVAALAAEAHTNREIAQGLFLSVKTVEGHLSNAYRKLDVRSRRELTAALGSDDTAAPAPER